MALITENVGEAVVKVENAEGVLYVGGNKLDRKEVREIKESAVKALPALYSHGLGHGHEVLRNMRVENRYRK